MDLCPLFEQRQPGRPGEDFVRGEQRSSAEGTTNVFHKQDQVQRVSRTGLELRYQMKVEVSGLLGFGVDQETSAADPVRQLHKSGEDVLQEPGSEPVTFVIDMDPKAGEQGYELWIAPCAFSEPGGSGDEVDLCHTPGVVGDHLVAAMFGHYEDTGRTGPSGLSDVASQPLGLLSGAATEPAQVVMVGQRFGGPVLPAHSTNGDGRSISRRRPGRSRARREPSGGGM